MTLRVWRSFLVGIEMRLLRESRMWEMMPLLSCSSERNSMRFDKLSKFKVLRKFHKKAQSLTIPAKVQSVKQMFEMVPGLRTRKPLLAQFYL